MRVKGLEINDAQINAMLACMNDRFRASDIEVAAVKAGVPEGDVAKIAACRMIQQQRNQGGIQAYACGPFWKKL
jgi:hypothetical protein